MEVLQKSVVVAQISDMRQFVNEATWKDILIELVKRNELDPWDINIVELVEKYVETVKEIKLLDLHIPANIILAAALLIRLKSEMLGIEEQQIAGEPQEEGSRPIVNVENLTTRLRLPPRRRITLAELINALDEVMKLKEVREEKFANDHAVVPLVINNMDVEVEAAKLYEVIKRHSDRSNMITFSSLLSYTKGKDALLEVFIPMLFLTQRGKVVLVQEQFFKEIIISFGNGCHNDRTRADRL